MPDQIPIAIDGISDPAQVRVMLYASGRATHAPLDAVSDAIIPASIHAAPSKATPADADEFGIADSAAGFILKKLTWANLKEGMRAFFYGANKATPVDGDTFGMLDSATTFSPKYSTWAQIKATLVATLNTWSAVQTFSAIPVLSGGAIAFPATQVPSAGANDLDDYEEGIWTPVLQGTTTAGVGTYSTQSGTYTKIGNRVFCDFDLAWSAHTGTGNMIITGLPFAPATNVVVYLFWTNLTYGSTPEGIVGPSTTTIILRANASGAGTTPLAMDTAADLKGGAQYRV